mgnify:FL=1
MLHECGDELCILYTYRLLTSFPSKWPTIPQVFLWHSQGMSRYPILEVHGPSLLTRPFVQTLNLWIIASPLDALFHIKFNKDGARNIRVCEMSSGNHEGLELGEMAFKCRVARVNKCYGNPVFFFGLSFLSQLALVSLERHTLCVA